MFSRTTNSLQSLVSVSCGLDLCLYFFIFFLEKGIEVDRKNTNVVKSWCRPLSLLDIRIILGVAVII